MDIKFDNYDRNIQQQTDKKPNKIVNKEQTTTTKQTAKISKQEPPQLTRTHTWKLISHGQYEKQSIKEPPEEPIKTTPQKSMVDLIPEHANIFKLSRQITQNSHVHPLVPENAYPVYITEEVVFKPGEDQALHAQIGYGLTRILGLTEAVVPAKAGHAIVALWEQDEDVEEGNNKSYSLVKHEDNFLLIESKHWDDVRNKDRISLEELLEEDGNLLCTINDKEYRLEREDDGYHLAKTTSKEVSMPKYYDDSDDHEISDDNEIIEVEFNEEMEFDENDEVSEEVEDTSFRSSKQVLTEVALEEEDPFFDKNKNTLFSVIEVEGRPFLVKMSSFDKLNIKGQPLTEREGHLYIQREGQEYKVDRTSKGNVVIVDDVKGMVQCKVPDPYKGENKDKPLDIRYESPERDDFYARIPMSNYIDAFMASLVLRPEDGKITDLSESNVLFSRINPEDPNSLLKPVLIDLDETLPFNNNFRMVETMSGKSEQANPVRLGLMGFPHAHRPLNVEERQQVLDQIKNMIDHKDRAVKYLMHFKARLHDAPIEAFEEMMARLESFHPENDEWTLADLCFHLLPAYKEDWDKIGGLMSPEEKAAIIGFNSRNDINKVVEKRRKQLIK